MLQNNICSSGNRFALNCPPQLHTHLMFKKALMYTLLFCAAFLGNADTQQAKAQFAASLQPNKQFPLPTMPFPYCSTTSPLPNFYGTRDGGNCYNYKFDFDGDGSQDNVYVWAIGHRSVHTYDNAVAYEVTNSAGTTLYRGTHYVGADIANLQVGIVRSPNVGITPYQLVVAYWAAGGVSLSDEIHISWFSMLPTGLNFTKDDLIYVCPVQHLTAQHISMDCSDSTTFSVAWEDEANGIHLIGYDALVGYSPIAAVPSTTTDARLPDIAMSQQVGGAAVKNVHLAYIETAGATPSILKYDVDFAGLMAGTPTFTLEDVETLTVPFGANYYDFQMDIDAPDHYTASQSDWAYVYYNNDANKIKVRVCDRTATPVFNTYVVNDGTMPLGLTPPFAYIQDLTNAGNAFPTLTYLPNSLGCTIGWYTTYNASVPPSLPNNPLFDYTGNAQVYVSVVMDIQGFLRTPAYNRVDMNYNFNKPKGDDCLAYPKINFSKNNEGSKLFALFQSHNNVDIWNYAGGGSPFLGKYAEWASFPGPAVSTPTFYVPSTLNYGNVVDPFYLDISIFLSQKMVDWYPFSLPGPLFKKAADNVISEEVKALSISPNPFSDKELFLINGGDANERYTVRFSSADGKILLNKEGTVAELNAVLRLLQGQNLAAGLYFVNVAKGKQNLQQFKIVKH
jgi:hypothetical protein